MNKNTWIRAGTFLLVGLCLIFTIIVFKAFLDGKFNSIETFQSYIAGYGFLAPIILIMVQAMQVIIPVLPGFLGCAVGAVMFGSTWGFWCNYIGISLGSIAAFWLARQFGTDFVRLLFPKDKYEKWAFWAASSKSYTVLLFVGMVLPLFPDDFFCYFSGLTKMKAGKFIWIIILGKPWCILAYSLGFALIG